MFLKGVIAATGALLLASADARGESAEYSFHAHESFPMQVFWGDTHVHSSFSMDANSTGNTRLGPPDAYRFAKGEAVLASSGMTARLELPLDFLVVSDHAEYMGLLPSLRGGDAALLADPTGKRLYDGLQSGTEVPSEVPTEIQDRAYSSPIWFTP